MQLVAQLFDLGDREAGFPLDERQAIAGHVFEMVAHEPAQLPGARGVGADLEEQALAQIAGCHAERVHALHDTQGFFEERELRGPVRRPVGIDEIFQRHGKIAVGVEIVDDLFGGLPFERGEIVVGELVVEVVEERLGPLLHVGHRVEIAIGRFVDPACRRPAAVVVGVGILVRPIVRPFEVGLIGMLLVDDEWLLVHRPLRDGRKLGDRRTGLTAARVTLGLLHLERFVVLNLLFDPFLERLERQLQDLHRLDHARRKHLLLRHPHFLAE